MSETELVIIVTPILNQRHGNRSACLRMDWQTRLPFAQTFETPRAYSIRHNDLSAVDKQAAVHGPFIEPCRHSVVS